MAFYQIKKLSPYELNKPNETFLINKFQEIGWPDPFPTAQPTTKAAFKIPTITEEMTEKYTLSSK